MSHPEKKRVVLVGAGHAHALLLKAFANKNLPHLDIVLVSPHRFSPYSGMIPGWIGGHYQWEACCIDFARLCDKVGATMLLDAVTEIQPDQNRLILQSGKTLDFDILSLNVGSTILPLQGAGPTLLPLRPISELQTHWQKLEAQITGLAPHTPFRIVTVGGGTAGVEVALAAAHHLKKLAPQVVFSFALATHGDTILPSLATGARQRIQRHLDLQHIELITHFHAHTLTTDGILSTERENVSADAVLLASGARPHDWLRESGLHLDAQGFVAVDAMLRSRSHPNIFASGDCAGWETPLPKAGVYAVRMSPALTRNILATVTGLPLQAYVPQNRYLSLIGTGNENAVASWGAYACEGRCMWRLKQLIDTRFVAKTSR